MPDKGLAILILAAGQSSRMGSPKQLLPWKDKTLLAHVIENALVLTKDVCVVLGAFNEIVEQKIPKNVLSVFNPNWELGMGSSIAIGMEKTQEKYRPKRVLVLLADQPLIDVAYIKRMLMQKSPIVATSYENSFGVPALFSDSFFEALKRLNSHNGAKKILNENKSIVIGLDAGHKNNDLDTPENYTHLFHRYGKK